MIITRCTLSLGRVVSLNKYRNFQTTETAQLRVGSATWKRVPRVIKRRIDREDDVEVSSLGELRADFLEEAYDHHVSSLNEQKKFLKKILTKKSLEKKVPDPNLLSWNERQQIVNLHESNPQEWTPEILSESFPALPSTIRKILKKKWVPSSIDRIREKDLTVLNNWEKYKSGKLSASPELLEHLKKFTDRRENLRAQIMNPNFYYLPNYEKEMDKLRGEKLGELIKVYRENEKLGKPKSKQLTSREALIAASNESSWTIKIEDDQSREQMSAGSSLPEKSGTSSWTVYDEIREEVECRDLKNVDSFLLGKGRPNSGEPEMTLEKLKESVLRKSEKGRASLSMFEEAILSKTIGETTEDKPKMLDNGGSNGKTEKPNLLSGGDTAADKLEKRMQSRRFHRRVKEEEEETVEAAEVTEELEDGCFTKYPTGNTRLVSTNELGVLLHGKAEVKENPNAPENVLKKKNKKTPVKYYGTEKDAMVFAEREKEVAQTAFWNSGRSWKQSDEFGAMTELSGPHVSATLKTYYTHDYPQKIEIPKEEWRKGMTYKVKDCYYDDDGTFLYRVPGLTKS